MDASIEKELCKLKACPFCGSVDTHIKYIHNPYNPDFIRDGLILGGYRAECRTCHTMSDVCALPELAAAKWNKRADHTIKIKKPMTNKEIMKLFCERYGIKIQDYRPLSDMYTPSTPGITIWTEEGDTILFFPKELEEETSDNK